MPRFGGKPLTPRRCRMENKAINLEVVETEQLQPTCHQLEIVDLEELVPTCHQ
jgi:hypothetical protein